ncbi:MAG: STAS domain-containing protein [Spirochaetia bacterium]|nr:STAS domain-containing protein [Spirochaetia bacterium]
MLELNTFIKNKIIIIELEGVLDSRTASDFKIWIEERRLDGYSDFILDLLKLEYLSSRGIAALTETNSLLRSRGGRMVICSPTDEVMRLLHFLKIDKIIPVCLDIEQAALKISEMPIEDNVTSAGSDNINISEYITERNLKKEISDNIEKKENVDTQSASLESKTSEKATTSVLGDIKAKIIYCQNCGCKLRVNKTGKYLCPSCRISFYYNSES